MTEQAEARTTQRSRNKGRNKVITALFLITFFVWLGYSLLHNVIVPQLINLEQPRHGFIQEKLDARGTLVFSEQVLVAPATGKLEFDLDEGNRVRNGSKIAEIAAQTIETSSGKKSYAVRAGKTGLLCFRTDGLEKVLTPGNINELDLAEVDKLKGNPPRAYTSGQVVNKGDVIGKIVNNLDSTFLYAVIQKGELADQYLQPGTYLQLQFGSNPDLYDWKIKDIKPIDAGYLIVMESRRFRDNFLGRRDIDFGIVTKRFTGEIIPEKAIVKKDGKPGVFIKHKESLRWKGIEITGKIGEELAVRGLSSDTLLVVNPGLAREGQPVK